MFKTRKERRLLVRSNIQNKFNDILFEIITKNPNIPWDESRLCRNPNITWEIVKNNLDKPWKWRTLSINPNITWEIVKDNPDINWDWQGLSFNPNITWEIVKNNLDANWSWWMLSEQLFTKDKEIFFIKEIRKYYKCQKNQKKTNLKKRKNEVFESLYLKKNLCSRYIY